MADAYVFRGFMVPVNLKSAAATLIVPVMTGKRFIPRTAFMRIKTVAGGSFTTVSMKIGNGGAFEICAAQAFTLAAGAGVANNLLEFAMNGSSVKSAFDIGTTGISVTVTVASNMATTHVADVYLEGYVI